MAFHDTRMPVDIERGARGGPMFKTTVIEMSSGQEQRNIDWSLVRHYFDAAYGVMNREDYEAVRTFFYNRRGRAHTFRFRDWSDYQLDDELIGIGDGVQDEFQITKTYSGELDYVRNITRPDQSTLIVKVNGIATVNYALLAGGSIDFSFVPALSDLITVTANFDIPMRFDTDKFELIMEWSEAGATGSLPIIEVREFV